MNLTLDQALERAVTAHKAGQIQEADRLYTAILQADPSHSDANHNLGLIAVSVGKLGNALPLFEAALASNSSVAQYWLSYLQLLVKLGKIEEAKSAMLQARKQKIKGEQFDQIEQWLTNQSSIASKNVNPPEDVLGQIVGHYNTGNFNEAIAASNEALRGHPQSALLHTIIGASMAGLGQLESAIGAYQEALRLKPDYAEAFNNLGVAQKQNGQIREAINSLQQAVKLSPNYAEAYSNLGSALKETGNTEAAKNHYAKAIELKPDYAEAYNNMGNVCMELSERDAAIDYYTRAIQLSANYIQAYQNLGLALTDTVLNRHRPDLQAVLCNLLTYKTLARPNDIAKAVVSLLKQDPAISTALQQWEKLDALALVTKIATSLSEIPLLLRLMSVCPVPDMELEKLFISLRAALTSLATTQTFTDAVLRFHGALALQCFINEFVYPQSREELSALQELERDVQETLAGGQSPSPQIVLCLASYGGLYRFDWANQIEEVVALKEVIDQQVHEPQRERLLREKMPSLRKIENEVSTKVREQYEQNPYPRWVNTGLRLAAVPLSVLAEEYGLVLADKRILDTSNPEILIAGCGTGQHSIGTAARVKDCKVTAVDLSSASLAYAARKTEEFGLQNIDYMQADILDLASLGRQFDIIESVGVLHHMDDPMSGWRVLAGCLKSGGLMRIGLYSELARHAVVKIREEVILEDSGDINEEMRRYRTAIGESSLDYHRQILQSHDFYSLSAVRDLLFHVQEHRFTLPQLKLCLEELGLDFCGFEMGSSERKSNLPDALAEDGCNLDAWAAFEELNPDTFAGMYQFWCQKRINL